MRSDEFDYILSEESLYDVTAEKEVELFSFKKQIHSVLEIDVKRYYYLGTEPEDVKQRIEMALDLLTLDLKRIQVLDPIPQNMRAFSRLSRSLMSDGANLAGFLCNHVNKDEIERKLSEVLTNFPENEITKCWAQSVGLLGKDAMLYCHEKWPGKKKPLLIDANGLSDGTLRLLAILTALLSAEPGTTIAIEEIDNGLHPSRAKLLVNLLHKIGTERGIDIICTTHNPALLDAFGLSMLPFIALVYRDPENGTSQIKNLDEIKNYERIITKGSLGDLITKGRFEGALKAH